MKGFSVVVKALAVMTILLFVVSMTAMGGSDGDSVHTVVFKTHDGTILKAEYIADGKGATAPEVPENGMVFAGWSEDFSVVHRDMEIYAVYDGVNDDMRFDIGQPCSDMGNINQQYSRTIDVTQHYPFTVSGYGFNRIEGINYIISPSSYSNASISSNGSNYTISFTPTAVASFTVSVNFEVYYTAKSIKVYNEYETQTWTVAVQANNHTVSFDANGGSGSMSSVIVTDGNSFTMPSCSFSAPSGQQFAGWQIGNSGTAYSVGSSYTTSGDVTLYAQWTAATYSVSVYTSAGGTVSGGGSGTTGQTAGISASPSTGFHFVNWSDGSTSSSRTVSIGSSNTSYTAFFSPNTYGISVSASPAGGGSVSGSGTYNYNTSVTISASPASGYVFSSWSDGSTSSSRTVKVTQSASYTANFTHLKVTTSLNTSPANGGTVSGAGAYDSGSSPILSASPASGFSFLGWKKDSSSSYASTSLSYSPTVTSNVTYTAYFQQDATTYTVIFKDDDATLKTQSGIVSGGSATPPTNPTKPGFIFSGWDGVYTNITSNKTVIATWTAVAATTYTVIFKDWDGEEIAIRTGIASGGSATPPDDPTREGCTFTGWNNSFTMVTADVVCTATYKSTSTPTQNQTHSVVYRDWDGSILKIQNGIQSGASASAPANPSRDGYAFSGWDRAFSNVTSDLNINATYLKNAPPVCFVTFVSNGEVIDTRNVEVGARLTAPATPTLEGSTFTSWFTDSACTNGFDFTSTVTSDLVIYAGFTADSSTDNPANNTNVIVAIVIGFFAIAAVVVIRL